MRETTGGLHAALLVDSWPLPNGYASVTWLFSGRLRQGRIIDQGVPMKLSLLISSTVAIVIAAVAMSTSASGSSGARNVPGFRSPSGNIHCYYDPKAFVASNGTKRLLTCGLRHADYAVQLQRRCLAGDWHGFGLVAKGRPTIFCTGNPNFSIRPVYGTLAYGKSWTRGPFTCTSRITGVTCHNRAGHGVFISRQSYRTW